MRPRDAALAMLLAAACSPSKKPGARAQHPPQVIRAIERALHDQLGVDVHAHCNAICGLPSSCTATLPDRTELPVRAQFIADAWSIELATPAITTAPIVAYVTGELADLGLTDVHVRCDPPIRTAPIPSNQIECSLGNGGRATVTIDPITSTVAALDLALEPPSTTAPPDDAQLEVLSRALAHLADDEEDDGNDKPAVRK